LTTRALFILFIQNRRTPPISPPFGPATGSFNGLHLKSKFLAIIRKKTAAKRNLGKAARRTTLATSENS